MNNIHPVCLTDKDGNVYNIEQIKQSNISMRWNHNHPPKMPSNFEVFRDSKIIYSGPFDGGMKIANELMKEKETADLLYCQQENLKLKALLHQHNIPV